MKLKVMTFNLRMDTEADGINYFPNREGRILETIRTEKPDLIGFQEASDYIREFLKKSLSDDYTVIGCGRQKNYRGEACCIAFRKDCFELVSFDTHFLSTSPTTPGSIYAGSDQSKCPRLYVHAELSHNQIAKPIHFFNTHLDHKGEQARVLGMAQVLQQLATVSGESVLTGDMNAHPDTACIGLVAALKEKQLKDATAQIERTFHNYGKNPEHVVKIDYIFTDAEPIEAYAIADNGVDGVYISDHYPVCAWIEFDEAE